MGKKRDAIFDDLQVNAIKAIIGQTILNVGTKFRYTEAPFMEDPNDIPSWGIIQNMGSGLVSEEFTSDDLLGSDETGYYLPYTLTDGESLVTMLVVYTDSTPTESKFPQYSGSDGAITGFITKSNVEYIKVWATG